VSDQFFWYVTRSAALITWLASALSILVGLLTSSRLLGRRPTIPWLVDLHRMFAAIAVTFLGVHMVSLWFDSFVRFRLGDLLIPWVASVPGLTRTSIALGVISAWLLAAVQATSLIRERLPERFWRSVHLLSFEMLGLGTLHAIQAGSDTRNPIVVGIGVSVLAAIGLISLVRLVRRQPPEPEEPTDPVDSETRAEPSNWPESQPEIIGPTGTGTMPPAPLRRELR